MNNKQDDFSEQRARYTHTEQGYEIFFLFQTIKLTHKSHNHKTYYILFDKFTRIEYFINAVFTEPRPQNAKIR